jgi:ribosomal protein S18 acetylase RimI-like enzyme
VVAIRAYKNEDWHAICRIRDRGRPDELCASCDPRAFVPIEQDSEVENLRRAHKYIACDSERVVGFVGVDGEYLAWLYVDPEYHGQGIGRAPLQTGLAEIGRRAWTIVLSGNTPARRLY